MRGFVSPNIFDCLGETRADSVDTSAEFPNIGVEETKPKKPPMPRAKKSSSQRAAKNARKRKIQAMTEKAIFEEAARWNRENDPCPTEAELAQRDPMPGKVDKVDQPIPSKNGHHMPGKVDQVDKPIPSENGHHMPGKGDKVDKPFPVKMGTTSKKAMAGRSSSARCVSP